MAAGGKGHAPRPFSVDAETYASNFDRIFGNRASRLGANPLSKSGNEGPIPSGAANCDDCKAAIYIDNETGAQVTEDWWPGDTVGYPSNA